MRWVQLCGSLSILWHCLSLGLEWKLTFSSPVATAEFPNFWHIECSTFTASPFRIWNRSTSFSRKWFLIGKSKLQKFSLCKKFHPMPRDNLGKTLRFLSTNPLFIIRINMNQIQEHKHVSVSWVTVQKKHSTKTYEQYSPTFQDCPK